MHEIPNSTHDVYHQLYSTDPRSLLTLRADCLYDHLLKISTNDPNTIDELGAFHLPFLTKFYLLFSSDFLFLFVSFSLLSNTSSLLHLLYISTFLCCACFLAWPKSLLSFWSFHPAWVCCHWLSMYIENSSFASPVVWHLYPYTFVDAFHLVRVCKIRCRSYVCPGSSGL